MTKAEEILCKKMFSVGNNIMFKPTEHKWVFINSNEDMTEERLNKFYDAGIGVVELSDIVFYIIDDYEYINGTFVACKDTVTSIPIVEGIGINIKAKTIDLTDFYGVLPAGNIQCDTLIIGNNVKCLDYLLFDSMNPYFDAMTGPRNYKKIRAQALDIKVVGDDPITNLFRAFSECHSLEKLDLSEANLLECNDFANMCSNCWNLYDFKCGYIKTGAQCTGIFRNTKLPVEYNEATFASNEFGKFNAVQKHVPVVIPVLDDRPLKIAITNLSANVMENLFPEYRCIIKPYQGATDSFIYPYAFLFLKDVAISQNTAEYLHMYYSEIAEELTGCSKLEALGVYNNESYIFK